MVLLWGCKKERGGRAFVMSIWRCLPELNRCTRVCRPLRNHSAKAPWMVYYILYIVYHNCDKIKDSYSGLVHGAPGVFEGIYDELSRFWVV